MERQRGPRRRNELRQLYREPEVSDVVKLKRLQWTGLVLTMEEQRGPRRRNEQTAL